MENIWFYGQANQGIERVCRGKHIKQHEWDPDLNNEFPEPHYDYISDYECIFSHPINEPEILELFPQQWQPLQQAKQHGMQIPITQLAHFTTEENAPQITNIGGFKGGLKKINEHEDGGPVSERFSWWSPKFSNEANGADKENGDEEDGDEEIDAINLVRVHLQEVIQPFLDEHDDIDLLVNQFATSDAFHPNPHGYGNVYFEYSIEDLCQFYENYVGEELQFKVLGTFLYKVEIMHAVLVCSKTNGAGMFGAYPEIRAEGDIVTRDGNGSWMWNPQSTGTKIVRLNAFPHQDPRCRRWEHVAFAFHLPEDDFIPVNDPASHRSSL